MIKPSTPAADSGLDALARAARLGEASAVREFLSAIAPPILRAVRQILGRDHPDVEDVLQEALLGTLEALPRFRGESSFGHFARRVGALTALNARRRFQLREQIAPRAPWEEAERGALANGSPADELERDRQRERFLCLLDELPPPQAEALALHCVLGYTVEETAAAAGVPSTTVRSRLASSKAALRERIEADDTLRQLVRGAS